jgi:hypothetical protein
MPNRFIHRVNNMIHRRGGILNFRVIVNFMVAVVIRELIVYSVAPECRTWQKRRREQGAEA